VNDDVDPNDIPLASDEDYEPPAVFDFGSVFTATNGSSSGSTDNNGQGMS
jgi:hypothetical protein